jgi:hypothetical protein
MYDKNFRSEMPCRPSLRPETRPVLALALLVFSNAEGTAATTEQRIAAIEMSVVSALVIKGETMLVVTRKGRMEQLKVSS